MVDTLGCGPSKCGSIPQPGTKFKNNWKVGGVWSNISALKADGR